MKRREVTVPVWVRSETAGRVAVRARVVYGLRGGPMRKEGEEEEGEEEGSGRASAAAAAAAGGAGGAGAGAAEGVASTEWARAEVLCVRPLAATVDVVSLQVSARVGFQPFVCGCLVS